MGSHQKKLVVTQTKGEILGKAFSYLRYVLPHLATRYSWGSALIVMGTVALIGYYNYVMFAPYLLPMCAAFLFFDVGLTLLA